MLVACLGLSVAGCSGSQESGADPATTTGAVETAGPTTAPSPTAEATPTTVPEASQLECRDRAGDNAGVIDLRSVTVGTDSGDLTLTYRWDGDTPQAGRALWVTTAQNASGGGQRRWEYRWSNGESETAVVVPSTGAETPVDGESALDDGSLVVRLPSSAADGLKKGWTFTSTVNIEGDDSDSCGE
jgi:hypothetical protein